jgi:hypothetical protein
MKPVNIPVERQRFPGGIPIKQQNFAILRFL